jgi:hypothetical protein
MKIKKIVIGGVLLVIYLPVAFTLAAFACFPSWIDQQKFFLRLGKRIRELRRKNRHSQEDMIAYGFSARHWLQS